MKIVRSTATFLYTQLIYLGLPLLLIFCKLTPRFIIIAGTERQDYANMSYHLTSGVKGMLISLVAAGVLATILFFIKLA